MDGHTVVAFPRVDGIVIGAVIREDVVSGTQNQVGGLDVLDLASVGQLHGAARSRRHPDGQPDTESGAVLRKRIRPDVDPAAAVDLVRDVGEALEVVVAAAGFDDQVLEIGVVEPAQGIVIPGLVAILHIPVCAVLSEEIDRIGCIAPFHLERVVSGAAIGIIEAGTDIDLIVLGPGVDAVVAAGVVDEIGIVRAVNRSHPGGSSNAILCLPGLASGQTSGNPPICRG